MHPFFGARRPGDTAVPIATNGRNDADFPTINRMHDIAGLKFGRRRGGIGEKEWFARSELHHSLRMLAPSRPRLGFLPLLPATLELVAFLRKLRALLTGWFLHRALNSHSLVPPGVDAASVNTTLCDELPQPPPACARIGQPHRETREAAVWNVLSCCHFSLYPHMLAIFFNVVY